MTFKVLVTGDIHVGRTSTKLPATFPIESARAVSGWEAVVDYAIEYQIDLLVLTGDIADQDNKFWEAIGPLESGIRRLAAAGIHTVAVSGNHDHDVLPRLADQLEESDAFQLLGRDGRWERLTIDSNGRAILHIDGWSFPSQHVDFDPVATYPSYDHDGIPVLGVLHGDLGAASSRYAPLSVVRLRHQRVDGWLLGHIHTPRLIDGDGPFILYPGSPQSLDPGEIGAHGPWRFQINQDGLSQPEMIPLSCCRYAEVLVDVTDIDDDAELERVIYRAIQTKEAACENEAGEWLQALSLRLRLSGHSHLLDGIAELRHRTTEYTGSRSAIVTCVNDVQSEVLPAADLESLSRGSSPLAVAARLLRMLETQPESEEIIGLVDAARVELEAIAEKREYAPLRGTMDVDNRAARSAVRDQLAIIVGDLLRQQEAME